MNSVIDVSRTGEVSIVSQHMQEQVNTNNVMGVIYNQFQLAVKETNKYAAENGWNGVKAIQEHIIGEFNRYVDFNISIHDGPGYFELPEDSKLTRIPNYFYLGMYSPSLKSKTELQEIIDRGERPDFKDVYDHWAQELKRTVKFYAVNKEQVERVRNAIKDQFLKAVGEVEGYAKEKNIEGFYVSGGWDTDVKVEERSHPLVKYALRQKVGPMDSVLGRVIPFAGNQKEFEEIVESGIVPDFHEVYDDSLVEMKRIIDYKVAPFRSILCDVTSIAVNKLASIFQ